MRRVILGVDCVDHLGNSHGLDTGASCLDIVSSRVGKAQHHNLVQIHSETVEIIKTSLDYSRLSSAGTSLNLIQRTA